MRTERELAHVLRHERELELSSHFGSRDELNEERVQILASDSERELAHIFHELLMLWVEASEDTAPAEEEAGTERSAIHSSTREAMSCPCPFPRSEFPEFRQ